MDDRRIPELLESLVDAWNRRDWQAFAGCFTNDADYVTGEGVRWSGRHAILRGMAALFASGGTGGKALVTKQTIRVLVPGVAVVHLHWRLADAGTALPGHGVSVFVLALHGETWLVEAAQNTDGAPSD